MLEQLLADMAGEYPAFGEVFLDERDIYLTNSLQAAAMWKLKPKMGPGNVFFHLKLSLNNIWHNLVVQFELYFKKK